MNRRLELIRASIIRRTIGGSAHSWVLSCFGPRADNLAKQRILVRRLVLPA